MEYTLKLQLEGAEGIQQVLAALKGGVGALVGGQSKTPASAVSNDLNKATASAGALNQQLKGVAETMRNIRKGDDLQGGIGGITDKMLALMSEADRAKIMAKRAEMSQSGPGKIRNPPPFQGPDMGGIMRADWIKKNVQGPDLTGALFAKWKMKNNVTKGLPDVTGADLAKVMGLPDITSYGTDWKRAALGGVAGMFNPWIGSRILSDVFKGGAGGKGGGVATGIFGAGGAMGFTEFYLAFKGIQTAFKVLKTAAETLAESFKRASALYSHALQTGLGLQFSTKRSLMANIMGVSEQEVFRFGAQMAYLNPKLEQASRILAETAKPLTKVTWDWKVLTTDISASFARLTSFVAPALDRFINRFDNFVKILNNFHPIQDLITGLASGKGGIAMNIWKLLFTRLDPGSPMSAMPNPQAWMKQLPASNWEHMGLVVGSGSQSYARDTAKNTKETATAVKTIAKFIAGGGSFGGHGAGGSWGMSENTANP